MTTELGEEEDERTERIARGIRAVRAGHGANCSSIGSVVDALFASAVLGSALFAAVAAALAREEVRVVGGAPKSERLVGGDRDTKDRDREREDEGDHE